MDSVSFSTFLDWLWIFVFLLSLLLEAVSYTTLFLWFSLGAIVAFIVKLFGASLYLQTIIFLIVSIFSILFAKPFIQKFLSPKNVKTNVDSLENEQGIVITTISDKEQTGEVKIRDIVYQAKSIDGSIIEKGETVIVKRIEGITLIVEKEKFTNDKK